MYADNIILEFMYCGEQYCTVQLGPSGKEKLVTSLNASIHRSHHTTEWHTNDESWG